MGIGIKDNISYGYMENNTFYANQYGIESYEKNPGQGGGSGDVVNCIFANSKSASLLVDNLSYINASYSLSNTDILPGLHNINDDPLFLNNLYLSFSSPAINKGDPSLPYDPDGTVADIGVYPFDQFKQTNLIINEIHYNPTEGNNYQFVELVNAGSSSINVNNFKFSCDISYQFGNEIITAGEYFILAKDKSLYEGNGYKVYQWQNGNLQSDLANLLLYDDKGNTLDFINYDSKYWWPKEPNGFGPSLELQNTKLENMVSNSWRSSYNNGGTPGRANNLFQVSNVFINEFLASNNNVNTDEYGDHDDWIELFNDNNYPVNIGGFYITDKLSSPYKYQIPFYDAVKTTIPAKGHILLWADDQVSQGILHVSFKLDKAGEEIGIVQILEGETLFIDSLTYSEQSNNISYGRYPDGSSNWIYFNLPTPADSNKTLTDIRDEINLPTEYSLSQNYPNPFNPTTKIKYTIPTSPSLPLLTKERAGVRFVTLKVYDVLGREVATLVNEEKSPGVYEVEFNGANLSSGIYLYRLQTTPSGEQAGDFSAVKKMILLK
jgi:hypothetical protein